MQNSIYETIQSSVLVKQKVLESPVLLYDLEKAISLVVKTYKNKGKVLFCGNGGSAADAQHLAAELAGRFYYDRPPLFAEALHVNTSFITAVSNDYGYDMAFARMVNAAGKKGDILVALSTSGNSPNIIEALQAAQKKQMYVIGFSGSTGGQMNDMCDILLKAPSNDTPRIQEVHMLLGHIFCEQVEKQLFPQND
ncbi:MAG: D-sedoheptulose-7-phosphate isomerase [Bacteroidota bacterium]